MYQHLIAASVAGLLSFGLTGCGYEVADPPPLSSAPAAPGEDVEFEVKSSKYSMHGSVSSVAVTTESRSERYVHQ